MTEKHALQEAWTIFRKELEIKHRLKAILEITPEGGADEDLAEEGSTKKPAALFERTYAAWKSFLAQKKSLPEFPPHAVDSFAQFWDKEILNWLRSREPMLEHEAESHLYKRYANLIHAPEVKRLLKTEQDRKDAFHISLAKCIAKWKEPEFKAEIGLTAYFKASLINACQDAVRKLIREKEMKSLDGISEEGIELIKGALGSLDVLLVQAALEEFAIQRPQCFDLFLKQSDGYELTEIAEMLHASVDSVKSKTKRCRKKFNSFFENFKKKW
ncbi:MAG: sigma-70 family RNA polymerase sigma factor [Haliscomenobacter sp.]|nr:sigma-70 family RNA polymerase sigma factor [Haliscomenobacter sp.]